MAVVVEAGKKTTQEAPVQWALGTASLFSGALFLLVLGAIYYTYPWLWLTYAAPLLAESVQLPGFFSQFLFLVAGGAAATVLVWAWKKVVGRHWQNGIRSGTFWACVFGLGGFVVCWLLGAFLEGLLGPFWAGPIMWGAYLGWILFMTRRFREATFQKWLVQFEQQGWFDYAPYKRGQGRQLRRLTILGVLVLLYTGIYLYLVRPGLMHPEYWAPVIPGLGECIVLWLPRLTLAVVLGLGGLWFAYRLVHYPTFADFLIATEVEMNKVSWPTLKSLKQDTIVVLVTVLLLTVFLYVVDIVWAWFMQLIGVVQLPR